MVCSVIAGIRRLHNRVKCDDPGILGVLTKLYTCPPAFTVIDASLPVSVTVPLLATVGSALMVKDPHDLVRPIDISISVGHEGPGEVIGDGTGPGDVLDAKNDKNHDCE